MTFVISGLSGSGKTTFGTALGQLLDTVPVRTSDFLIKILGETRDKDGRLFAWANRTDNVLTIRELLSGLEADQEHLYYLQANFHGIHESLTLPVLLTPNSATCRIFLYTPDACRYQRVAERHGIDLETAASLTARKDDQTRLYLEVAYGLKLSNKAYMQCFDIILPTCNHGEVERNVAWNVSAENQTLLEKAIELVTQRVGRGR